MTEALHLLAAFTARQYGLVARWQALGGGVSEHALDHLVRRGVLLVVHPGVYRLRGVPFTQELRWLGAVLAGGPGAGLCGLAAADLHGFAVRRARPSIVVPFERKVRAAGVDVTRTRRRTDLVVVRKIPVTTRRRTILDLAPLLADSGYRDVVQDAIARNLVDVPSLLAVLDQRGGRGVDGTRKLRLVMCDELTDDRLESKLELLLARIVHAAVGVPRPELQHELTCSDGRSVRLDKAWPDRRIAVEANGRRWHSTESQVRKDRARRRSIVATGWQHYEYGWSDAVDTPLETRREIESLFRGKTTAVTAVDVPQNGGLAA